jgi:hypothetical protein
LNKWKKVLIGAVLLIGFVFFTQYKKNAEPAWEVNRENFQVVESWKELLQMETLKFEYLKFATKFDSLKDHNISVPLINEHREMHIEKTWNYGYQFYLLYSVDINERDKNEMDVPGLTVGKIVFSTSEGEEVEVPAEYNNGETSSSGYVYKHRLYRSLMIYPNYETLKEEDWEKIRDSVRFELNDLYMSKGGDSELLKPIAFKKSPEEMDEIPETIAALPINQVLEMNDHTTVKFRDLEIYKMGSRFSLEHKIGNDTIFFIGELKRNGGSYPTEYQVHNIQNGKTIVENYAILNELINMEEGEKGESTITHSVHRTDKSFSFLVSKKEIDQIKKEDSRDIPKNEIFIKENGIEGSYKGLTINPDSRQPVIAFSLENTINNLDYFMYPRQRYHFEGQLDDPSMVNLITIKDASGEELKDYDIMSIYNEDRPVFHISFYEGLPSSDLTITISNVISIEPLKKPISIPLELPEKVKK